MYQHTLDSKQLRNEYFLQCTELALLVSHLTSDHAIVLRCHIFQRLTVEYECQLVGDRFVSRAKDKPPSSKLDH